MLRASRGSERDAASSTCNCRLFVLPLQSRAFADYIAGRIATHIRASHCQSSALDRCFAIVGRRWRQSFSITPQDVVTHRQVLSCAVSAAPSASSSIIRNLCLPVRMLANFSPADLALRMLLPSQMEPACGEQERDFGGSGQGDVCHCSDAFEWEYQFV